MTLLLLFLALAFRASGAGLRCERLPVAVLAWIVNGTAAWLVTSAMGAWSPAWPVAAIALVGGYWEYHQEHVRWRSVGDSLIVFATAMISAPALGWEIAIPVALAMSLIGAVLDSFLNERAVSLKWGVAAVPVLVLSLLIFSTGSARAHVTGLAQIARVWGMFSVGATPFAPGEPITLATGAVGWWKCPKGEGPFPGVLFFHGNNRSGGQQHAAEALRRALLQGGFAVLFLDHPGFGESPLPDVSGPVEAWDPLPHDLAALEWMRRNPDVSGITIAGHSMGTIEVLRLLARPKFEFDAAVLFGSSLLPQPPREEYWFERFHRERLGFGDQKLSLEQYREIRHAYYDPAVIVARVTPEHPPVLFVDFAVEGQDIVATRDELYERIPGSKERWFFECASHYLNVLLTKSVLVGDTRPTRWVAERFRSFATAAAAD